MRQKLKITPNTPRTLVIPQILIILTRKQSFIFTFYFNFNNFKAIFNGIVFKLKYLIAKLHFRIHVASF